MGRILVEKDVEVAIKSASVGSEAPETSAARLHIPSATRTDSLSDLAVPL
jgi:hypothetical protein